VGVSRRLVPRRARTPPASQPPRGRLELGAEVRGARALPYNGLTRPAQAGGSKRSRRSAASQLRRRPKARPSLPPLSQPRWPALELGRTRGTGGRAHAQAASGTPHCRACCACRGWLCRPPSCKHVHKCRVTFYVQHACVRALGQQQKAQVTGNSCGFRVTHVSYQETHGMSCISYPP